MANGEQLYSDLFEEDDFESSSSGNEASSKMQEPSEPADGSRRASLQAETISVPQAEFADPNHLVTSTLYIRSTLQSQGFPHDFNPESGSKKDAAKMCNIVFALLMQHQRDKDAAQESRSMAAQLDNGLHISEQARNRLESRLLAKEREIGALENKLRSAAVVQRTDMARSAAEAGDLQKSVLALRKKLKQAEHAAKRRDQDVEKLQERLHTALSNRQRGSGDNQDAAGKFNESVQRAASLRRDEDTSKRLVAESEEKVRELLSENKKLRVAYESLQEHQRSISMNLAQRESQLNTARRDTDARLVRELSDLSPAGALAKLQSKLEQLNCMSDALCESIPISPVKDGAAMFEQAKVLKSLMDSARKLLAEYATLSKLVLGKLESSLTARGSQNGVARSDPLRSSGLHVSLPHLEEEYRAKVLELESKLATAHMKGQRRTSDSSADSTYEARDQAERARLALSEERARVAEALEAQAKELSLAKLEFENTKAAFDETMRRFAPGFGAGGFLARAMAKKASKAANEKGNSVEKAHAAERAVHQMGIPSLLAK